MNKLITPNCRSEALMFLLWQRVAWLMLLTAVSTGVARADILITFSEQGSDVVAVATGTWDSTGYTPESDAGSPNYYSSVALYGQLQGSYYYSSNPEISYVATNIFSTGVPTTVGTPFGYYESTIYVPQADPNTAINLTFTFANQTFDDFFFNGEAPYAAQVVVTAPTSVSGQSQTITFKAVPEPSAFALLAAAGTGFYFILRRRTT